MIFSSFGNVPLGFNRLAEALDNYAHQSGERIVVQYGNTDYNFKYIEKYNFLDHEQMISFMNDADILVLQGGWGTISEALDLRKRIVAVPRIKGIEHNHTQEELVIELEKKGYILGVYNIEELSIVIEKAKKYDFIPLVRGSATSIINQNLQKWFSQV